MESAYSASAKSSVIIVSLQFQISPVGISFQFERCCVWFSKPEGGGQKCASARKSTPQQRRIKSITLMRSIAENSDSFKTCMFPQHGPVVNHRLLINCQDRDPLAGWFTDEGEHSTRGCKTPLSILAHPYTVIAGTYQYLKVIEDQYKKTVTTIGFLFDIQLEFDPGQRISFTAQLSKFAQQRYGEAVKALESEMVRRNMVDLNFFRPGTSLGKQRNRNVPSVVKLPPTQRLRLLSAEEAANRTGSRVLPTLEA